MLTSDETRILGLCAPTVIKMLKGKEDKIIARMYGEFRNGKTEHLAALAELACVRDLIHEINMSIDRFENEKGNA